MASILKKIDWAINAIPLGMLIFGAMMITAPFIIKYHGNRLNPEPGWSGYGKLGETLMDLYCSTEQFSSWDTFWQGIVVVLTSFFLFTPDTCPYWKTFCSIFVFLSMVSAFTIVTEHANTMQRIRHYDIWTCSSDSYHYHRLRSWSYVLISSSYIVLCLCIVQLVASAVRWILELTSRFEHLIIANNAGQTVQQSNDAAQTSQQSSTARPSSPELPSYIGMRVLQPISYQHSLGGACPYHSHQPPPTCHQCDSEAWYSSRGSSRRCHKIMPY
ncbi:uncharacterized protein LOC114516837 [Dendronephthya gigantea]|uniref:uncharacterized protein LOC114516837 n=1 Tax=Dendronephthya gigantea TaxID=151771 RepID=UPI00106B4792|nr:uncharacterized protein LOC114516837 [Dendronephthya gigantea]